MDFRYGNMIRNIRVANGFTQEHLAEKIGVNKGTISAYELEKRTPSLTTFYSICKICNSELYIKIKGKTYDIKQLNRKFL